MNLGVVSALFSYAGLPQLEALERISAFGILHVDILTRYDAAPSFWSDSYAERLKAALNTGALKPAQFLAVVPGNCASINSNAVENHKTTLIRTLEYGLQLGFRLMLFNQGNYEVGVPRTRTWDNSVGFIKDLCAWAEERDAVLSFETGPFLYRVGQDLVDARRLLDAVGSNRLAFTMDTGHMLLSREGPETVKEIGDSLIHLHLTDNDGMFDTNEPLGAGGVDLRSYVEAALEAGIEANAARHGLECVAAIEIGTPFGPSIQTPQRVLRLATQYLREEIPILEM